MNTSSNGYVLAFAVGLCVIISSALSLTAGALKETQAKAEEFDRQKNVMIAAGLLKPDEQKPRAELEQLYRDRVDERVLEIATGATGKITPDAFKKMRDVERKPYRLIAVTKDGGGKEDSWVFPISGPGLWSILYGFLALEADGQHVRGLTFYKHGETPGLGGECENPEWTARWAGKSIVDDAGKLVSITVKKGHVDPSIPREKEHMVDGLSGATITSNGITTFLKHDLQGYMPLLTKIWSKKG
ncbi:MAG: NADH:ubiquinone reductase (Na(+)-transporting) subunit C [Planctomycetes bacterium]|nr:NADH:ubiquinone reductase (Na(+)-transporting) subunit C [Planctomycetota bacterium]